MATDHDAPPPVLGQLGGTGLGDARSRKIKAANAAPKRDPSLLVGPEVPRRLPTETTSVPDLRPWLGSRTAFVANAVLALSGSAVHRWWLPELGVLMTLGSVSFLVLNAVCLWAFLPLSPKDPPAAGLLYYPSDPERPPRRPYRAETLKDAAKRGWYPIDQAPPTVRYHAECLEWVAGPRDTPLPKWPPADLPRPNRPTKPVAKPNRPSDRLIVRRSSDL